MIGDDIRLQDAFKQFTDDLDKLVPPEETIRRIKAGFARLDLHILDKTVRIDNGRLDIPVYFSVCGTDAARLTGTRKQMGKGATPSQAEASAIMELVERFSFYSFADNPENFIFDTFRNLKAPRIDFESIARSVHDDSDDPAVIREIFADLPMRWVWGYNLTREERVLVPFDWFFAINEFNGTSAGNCPEEALCQGICEIVERHVSALVCRDGRRVPAIDPDSVTDPVVRQLIEKYRKNGISIHLADFTLDMGIPSAGVLAHDPATFPSSSEIVWTAGTATRPEKALSRALTETAQLGGDFNSGSNYVASGLPKLTSLAEAGLMTRPETRVPITALPDISDPNFKTEVQRCLSALSGRGFEVIAINTTHPQLNAPAFYTIICGAHFRERAAATSVGMFSCKLIAEKTEPASAVAKLEKFDLKLPGKYYVSFYLGTAHLALGDPETAYARFARALELNPDPQDIPSICTYMSICLKDLGQYEKALEILNQGLATDPERTDILNLMGFCHFKLKQYEQAIDCFSEVVRLNPASGIDYANIASNYRDLGDTQKAIEYYRIALAIDPAIEFARDNLERLREK